MDMMSQSARPSPWKRETSSVTSRNRPDFFCSRRIGQWFFMNNSINSAWLPHLVT